MEEKDTPKGSKAALWNLAFIRGLGGETCGRPTNSPGCNLRDLGPSVACGKHTVSTDSIVLHELRQKRWHLKNNRRGVWSAVGWLHKIGCLSWHPYPKGTSYGDAEASPSGRSTQSAWKQCGARHARLNRVTRTIARWYNQSTSGLLSTLTPGIQGDRNPLGTPFSPIFRRATKDGATGGREQSRAAGKKRTAKDGAPGGPTEKRMPVKT